MAETASSLLAAWSTFYFMTASSAAALTGLMFVVISLVTGQERTDATQDGIATFTTPTVMHFAAALLVSGILIMPWRSLVQAGIVVAVIGLYGVAQILRVMGRTRRLTGYTADLEDWTWFTILPLGAYVAISAQVEREVAAQAAALTARYGVSPGLAAVLVGDDPASVLYVRRKAEAFGRTGMRSETFHLPASTAEAELLQLIATLNARPDIHGILPQQPMPEQ